jgi:heme/copper-type cytochrome/quinol oxidase subunit 1
MSASLIRSIRVAVTAGVLVFILPWIWAPLTAGVVISALLQRRCHPGGYLIAGILTSLPFIALGQKLVGDVIFDLDERPTIQGINIVVAIAASVVFVWVGAQGYEQFRKGQKSKPAEQGMGLDAE